jgi:hypothetical protein
MINRRIRPSTLAIAALAACAALLLTPPAQATGTFGVDVATLNELLPALTGEKFEVVVLGDQTVTLRLDDLEVTGFDPSAGNGSTGHILTRVTVAILDLGIKETIRPSLSLEVLERDKQSWIVLRFEKADIPLPLLGDVDIGRLIPPLEFPAESLFTLQGTNKDVNMRGWLTAVKMGQKVLQFEFEVEREKE